MTGGPGEDACPVRAYPRRPIAAPNLGRGWVCPPPRTRLGRTAGRCFFGLFVRSDRNGPAVSVWVGPLEMPLRHLQWADPFNQRSSERVRMDRKIRKTRPSGPTQMDRRGPVDPFPAQMWERDGSARISERFAHTSGRASSCPAWPHLAAALPRPVFFTAGTDYSEPPLRPHPARRQP
jgi:hypothetical protein